MPLTLVVTAYRNEPPAEPLSKRFGQSGGTIGREPHDDLILPGFDLSPTGLHAKVDFSDGSYRITDVGQHPIVLNGRRLNPQQSRPLAHGDQMSIGDYALFTELEPDFEPHMQLADVDTSGGNHAPPAFDIDLSLSLMSRQSNLQQSLARATMPSLESLDQSSGEQLELLPFDAALMDAEDCAAHLQEHHAQRFGEVLKQTVASLQQAWLARIALSGPRASPVTHASLADALPPSDASAAAIVPEIVLQEAFDDLQAHDRAVMTAMREALHGTLKRFDPAVLEKRLQRSSLIDGIVPMHRKAKMWDLLIVMHEQFVDEAEAEFDRLFRSAYRRASGGGGG